MEQKIKTVAVIFKYPGYVHYLINDSNRTHSKKDTEIYKYLIQFLPEFGSRITKLLNTYTSFFMDIDEKKITALQLDYETEIKELRNQKLSFPKEPQLEIKENSDFNQATENLFEKISRSGSSF